MLFMNILEFSCFADFLYVFLKPEMEFLDMNFTKDSSLLLHAIHSLFYLRILQKTTFYSGFKTPYKKYTKQENEGRKPD